MALTPNPADDMARLSFNIEQEADVQVQIVSLDGKVIENRDLGTIGSGNKVQEIDVRNLNTGMYMVKLIAGKQAATLRLIVR